MDGYGTVEGLGDGLACEFVAFRPPVEPVDNPQGPEVVYLIVHEVAAWEPGEWPSLRRIRATDTLPIPWSADEP